jgi:hypothetical protein
MKENRFRFDFIGFILVDDLNGLCSIEVAANTREALRTITVV